MRNGPIDVDSPLAAPPRSSLPAFVRASWQRFATHEQALGFGVVYLVWGSTYLAIRIGVESIPPFLLAGARSLTAGLILLAWARLHGAARASARDWGRASVAGVLMLAGGNGLVTWAETRISSSLAALLIALVPSYVTLIDWARPGGTRPTRAASIGVGIGVLGMLLLVRPPPGAIQTGHWEGIAAVSAAGFCWALGSLYARYQPMHPSRAASAAHQMIAGGVALTTVAALEGEIASFDPAAVTPRSALALVYLTVFGSLVAFSVFSWLVGVTTPARLSTTAYVNPLVAMLLGALVLGERLQALSFAGALLIVAAVVLMARAKKPPASALARPQPALPLPALADHPRPTPSPRSR